MASLEDSCRKVWGGVKRNRPIVFIFNILFWAGDGMLDFGSGFFKRKDTKGNKASRWGAKFGEFADNVASNAESRAQSGGSLLPTDTLGMNKKQEPRKGGQEVTVKIVLEDGRVP